MDTCRALGMLQDDQLWHSVMEDAAHQQLPLQMRELFVMLLTFVEISDPKSLFDTFQEAMSEDFAHHLLPPDNTNHQLIKWMLLIDIKERLESMDKGVMFVPIGVVTDEMLERVATARRQYNLYREVREIREELAYNRDEMTTSLNIADRKSVV